MYILFAILSLTGMGLGFGFLLGAASRYFKVEENPLIEEIESMMPGSQCGQCGYPGCRPAAEALVAGERPATLCPTGGRALAEPLANKLSSDLGLSDVADQVPMVARVDESNCIGCTRCYKVCPTDALVGAPKQIHVVVADACIACAKCVDVCPTECLRIHPVKVTLRNWRWPKPETAPAKAA
jgi:electron transport complex protein RnfB